MDISKLVRDADYVRSQLIVRKGKVIAKQKMQIHSLAVLANYELIVLGKKKEIFGSFAVVCNGRYMVWNAVTMYEIKALTSEVIDIEGVDHLVFTIEAGDTLIESLETIVNAGLVYKIFRMYIFQGKVPWFINIGDITKLFSTCGEYAGLGIDETPELINLLEALMTRVASDEYTLLKNSGLPAKEWEKNRAYIPLSNVAYMQSVMGKIVGNYQKDGMREALGATPSEPGILEKIMRT